MNKCKVVRSGVIFSPGWLISVSLNEGQVWGYEDCTNIVSVERKNITMKLSYEDFNKYFEVI